MQTRGMAAAGPALALASALAALTAAGCSSVTQSARNAVDVAVDKTVGATRATVEATKSTFAKTRDFIIPWGKDEAAPPPPPPDSPAQGGTASPEVAAAGAQGEADPPPAPPTEEELREAEERARRQAVANATLSPASFGGAVPDRSGLWAVAGWQVEAGEAWLERDAEGEIARFHARGDVVATRNTDPEPTVIEGTAFSVLPPEGMLVTQCRRITQGPYEIRASGRSMTVAITSDGAISISGPSESRYVGAGG